MLCAAHHPCSKLLLPSATIYLLLMVRPALPWLLEPMRSPFLVTTVLPAFCCLCQPNIPLLPPPSTLLGRQTRPLDPDPSAFADPKTSIPMPHVVLPFTPIAEPPSTSQIRNSSCRGDNDSPSLQVPLPDPVEAIRANSSHRAKHHQAAGPADGEVALVFDGFVAARWGHVPGGSATLDLVPAELGVGRPSTMGGMTDGLFALVARELAMHDTMASSPHSRPEATSSFDASTPVSRVPSACSYPCSSV